jgi:hypothetical protein
MKSKSLIWESEFPKAVRCLAEDALLDRPLIDVASASATPLPRAGEHSSVEVCNAGWSGNFCLLSFHACSVN